MESPPCALPKCRDLSLDQLAFLDENFSTREDLIKAHDLSDELSKQYTTLDFSLADLKTDLRKHIVMHISHLVRTRSALQNINVSLQNLSLYTSKYGTYSRTIQTMLDKELPLLVKKMRQIGDIWKYVETALHLEALVGDLEDAVLFVANHHTGNKLLTKLSNSSIARDFENKHEKLLLAVKAMNKIEDMLLDVVQFFPQWHNLLESVDARVDRNLAILRPQVLADHRALLVSLGWPPKLVTSRSDGEQFSNIPNPLVLMQGDKKNHYSRSFLALCALQHLQTRREERMANTSVKKVPESELWAISELVSPIAERMEYHFLKWVDQPEFVFALVHKVTKDFIAGVDDVLQPLIDEARLVGCSAKEASVSAMVQMLSIFLKNRVFGSLAERYKDKSQKLDVMCLWLHLIDHAVTYDKRMQSLVNLETGSVSSDSVWVARGISVLTIFCERPDWHKLWGKIELKVAWKKLKEELKGDRAWVTDENEEVGFQKSTGAEDYLLSTREDYKAPFIIQSVLKICWEMIERCQTLPAVSVRIQFIKSTSVRFLWHFFNVMLLQFKRTGFHPSKADSDSLKGVCGLINAAKYLESKLREWSDDLNFLEMTKTENDSAMCLEDNASDSSFFFGEEIKSLAELQTNWLMDIISFSLRHFESLSWEYFQNKECFKKKLFDSTSLEVAMTTEISISDYLVEAFDDLRSQLLVVKKSLSSKDFVDFWRSVAKGLDHFISHSIMTSDIQFSDAGVNQFVSDTQALFSIFQPFCSRPQAFFPSIREMIMVLKMKEDEVKHVLAVFSSGESRNKYLQSLGYSHLQQAHVHKLLKSRKFRT